VAWHAVRAFDAAGPLISRSRGSCVRIGPVLVLLCGGRAMKRASLPLLLRCMSPDVCRFLDAGMTNRSTRCGGRRPKSAKARNRGAYAGAVPRALWGFCRGFRLAEAGL
jgi:hypothetical protein